MALMSILRRLKDQYICEALTKVYPLAAQLFIHDIHIIVYIYIYVCTIYTCTTGSVKQQLHSQPLCHAPQLLTPFNMSRMETWTKSRV